MMKKKIFAIIIPAIIWLLNTPNLGHCFSIIGRFRDDFAITKLKKNFYYNNLLENKFVLSTKREDWRFYSDFRLYLINNQFQFNVLRSFIRYKNLTIGKIYVNFGYIGLFNPFEINKNINFSDLQYDKQGIMGLVYQFPLGILSGVKLYVSPDTYIKNTGLGFDAFTNLYKADIGFVFNRKKENENKFGFYLKGDMKLGFKTAYATYFDDKFDSIQSELNIGIDYSFSKLLVAVEFYYNGRKADKKEEYITTSSATSFLKARQYIYSNITYLFDEFFNAQVDNFVNLVDFSFLIIPSIKYTLANGLNLNVLFFALGGDKNDEFSRDQFGDYSLIIRIESKF